jgi:hypothetical protein
VTMKNGVFWDVTPCGSCKNCSSETSLPAYKTLWCHKPEKNNMSNHIRECLALSCAYMRQFCENE